MATTLVLNDFSAVREFSDRLNDGLFRVRNYYTGSSPITVVVIDDASLAQDGRWPWPRGQLARLVSAISATGPKAIGLDILLSEPSDASDDTLLSGAIRQAGNVVLPAKLSTSRTGPLWIEPLPLFAQAAAGVGHVQAILDADGVCRRLPDAEMSLHGTILMMAKVLIETNKGTRKSFAPDTHLQFLEPSERSIDYRGLDAGDVNAKPFQTISAAKILSGGRYSFSHRIVLVGFAGSGLEDELLTPLNYRSPAPGVLIQANMVDTLDRSRSITSEILVVQISILLGICLLGSIAIRAHKGRRTAIWVLAAPPLTYLAAYAIFILWGIQFHLGLALLAEVLVIPLGQLQHVLMLQTLIGRSLVHLQEQTEDLPLQIANLLELKACQTSIAKRTLTNAEWKLEVIARTEEQITIVSAFQQTLLDAMRDGIAVFGEDGLLMFHNPTWKAFLTFCRWTEESCWIDLRLALRSEMSEAMDPRGTTGTVNAFNEAAGKEVLIADRLWRISLLQLPTFAQDKRAIYMALCADLTPQMERDQARQQALQFITHELRTPLVSLQGFAELLQRFPQQAEAAGAADIIHRESERLVALTSMYLECLRLETTLPVLSPGLTDAVSLMKRTASVAKPLCDASNKSLRLTMPNERIDLYIDAAMITGALLNLIANAVKYGAENTDVRACVQVFEETLMLSICNNGQKIPDKEQSRLFAPQYRMPENASGRPGWGIGLTFVKRVMEAHGGSVHVRSDEFETCFQLLIPLRGLSRGGAI